MAEYMDHYGMDGIDDVGDAALIAVRAQQAQDRVTQQQNKQIQNLTDGPGGPAPLAAPDNPNAPGNAGAQQSTGKEPGASQAPKGKMKRIVQRTIITGDPIIYNSMDRPIWYHAFAWLWCGCYEPKYKITTKYILGEEWEGCERVNKNQTFFFFFYFFAFCF